LQNAFDTQWMKAFNLDSAIEREKGVQDIGVHRKLENFVVTLLVMKIFSGFLGVSIACAYFRDSIAEFKLKH
jgi:hypothetical protein